MRTLWILVVLSLTTKCDQCHAAKILGLFQFPGRSHFIMFERLCKALASRGHEVTVLSHWPQKPPVPNYTDISLANSMNTFFNNLTMDFVHEVSTLHKLMQFIWQANIEMCEQVLQHPKTIELVQSSGRYDLIITEVFGADCFVTLAHKWNVPFISMISSSAFPWAYTRLGNPDHPAYMPNYFLPYHGQMTFTQRLWNTFLGQVLNWGVYFYHDIPMQRIVEKYFGYEFPPISEMVKQTSLILVNSHFSINQPTPSVPALVEVGGLHIPDPKPLPQDIERYISESENGVVYFSMGSLVKTDTFDPQKLKSLLDAFSRLKQRVLLKINPENLPSLPQNVLAIKWLPQSDILRHPKTVLFVTHGGLMSTQEAVHAGVPMLGIPLFADQHFNVHKCESLGIAVKLEYGDITTDSVLHGLRRVLDNESFSKQARYLSELFRDRPQTALESAVFWTEYVIRHRGAEHMRSPAVRLPSYQYLLLDVLAAAALSTAFGIALVWCCVRNTLGLWCKTPAAKKLKTS